MNFSYQPKPTTCTQLLCVVHHFVSIYRRWCITKPGNVIVLSKDIRRNYQQLASKYLEHNRKLCACTEHNWCCDLMHDSMMHLLQTILFEFEFITAFQLSSCMLNIRMKRHMCTICICLMTIHQQDALYSPSSKSYAGTVTNSSFLLLENHMSDDTKFTTFQLRSLVSSACVYLWNSSRIQ